VRVVRGRSSCEVITVEFLLIAAVILAFEYAAVRWGYDSRDDFVRFKRR
jgi:hypothetical protein